MTISAVAKQAGVRPSAIRYYESIGLLASPPRRAGQRSYDARVLRRLAVIRQAQDAGFTLDEIRNIVDSRGALAEEWNRIGARKLEELDEQINTLRRRQELIRRVQESCHCRDADECGAAVLNKRRMLSSTLDPSFAPDDPHLGR
jgi:MerR family redox-sensitive transcriptional activator SoxR